MFRNGFELRVQPEENEALNENAKADALELGDDESSKIVEALEQKSRELNLLQVLRDALCYERAYGGAAVLLGVDDGEKDLTKPLDESKIKSITHLNTFRGGWDGEVIQWRPYNDMRKPKYGMPEMYMLRNLGVQIATPAAPGESNFTQLPMPVGPTGSMIFYVHESRLIIFPGTAVSHQARTQMRGWGDSVFTRVDEVLNQYSQTWGSISNLMTDWAQGVLRMSGLADALAGPDGEGGTGQIRRRLVAIQMSKSMAKTLLLDKDEEFKREVTPLSGIAEVLEQFSLRLAAAADMPVSLLLGQAPAGLNATGASDIRFFYDRVAAKQRNRLLPPLYRLYRLMMLAKDGPTKGVEPARWSIELNPLWQPTESEEIEMRNKQAQTDQIYIANGVLTPEEVAASRFGGSQYSTNTVLDLEERQAMSEMAKEEPASPPQVEAPPEGTPKIPPQESAPDLSYSDPSTTPEDQ
jgi:phage-related protein (TIGR01555 family)